ncbi:hypothetical protein [uncultured Tenacibaculum sp.]|uniref:hypothetical protein n=1 Tax=uncultured Tenacibaculum sp. TaxID=174713 RepID=UPI00261B1F57|nr:hypothetical protein [uncultured Tenacibaculum sp.]
MKKQILNLGKTLSKKEQKAINGGVDCFDCQDYCIANSGGNRMVYGICMDECISQYC